VADSDSSRCGLLVPATFPQRAVATLRLGSRPFAMTGGPWTATPSVDGALCDDVDVRAHGLGVGAPCLDVPLDLRVTTPGLALVLDIRPDDSFDAGALFVHGPGNEFLAWRPVTSATSIRVPVTRSGIHRVQLQPSSATQSTARVTARLGHVEPPRSAYDARLTHGGPRYRFTGGPFTGATRQCPPTGPGCDEWTLYLPESGTLSVRLHPGSGEYEGNDFDLIVEDATTGDTYAAYDADSDEWVQFRAHAGVWYLRVMGYRVIDGSYFGAVRVV
jgi:hypothetical protein